MRALVTGKFIRAVVKHGDKPIVSGAFYQAPEDGRVETVEFYGDPAELKGVTDVAEGTICTFDVTSNARASKHGGSAYLSVKCHGFRVAAPEKARS